MSLYRLYQDSLYIVDDNNESSYVPYDILSNDYNNYLDYLDSGNIPQFAVPQNDITGFINQAGKSSLLKEYSEIFNITDRLQNLSSQTVLTQAKQEINNINLNSAVLSPVTLIELPADMSEITDNLSAANTFIQTYLKKLSELQSAISSMDYAKMAEMVLSDTYLNQFKDYLVNINSSHIKYENIDDIPASRMEVINATC